MCRWWLSVCFLIPFYGFCEHGLAIELVVMIDFGGWLIMVGYCDRELFIIHLGYR